MLRGFLLLVLAEVKQPLNLHVLRMSQHIMCHNALAKSSLGSLRGPGILQGADSKSKPRIKHLQTSALYCRLMTRSRGSCLLQGFRQVEKTLFVITRNTSQIPDHRRERSDGLRQCPACTYYSKDNKQLHQQMIDMKLKNTTSCISAWWTADKMA